MRILAPFVVAACLAALSMASRSAAADISVGGFFSQSLEGREGGNEETSTSLRAVTDIGLSFAGRTPTTQWRFAPGARLALSSTGLSAGDIVAPRLDASVTQTGLRRTLTGTLRVLPEFVSDARFENASSDTEDETLQISIIGRVGMSYSVTPIDSVSVGASVRLTEFTSDTETLNPTQTYGIDAGLSRSLSLLTKANLSLGLSQFSGRSSSGSGGSSGGDGGGGQSLSLRGGFSTETHDGGRISASLGPSVTFSDGTSSLGVVGSLDMSGPLGPLGYTLRLSQDVDQNSDGAIENRTRIGGGLSYGINTVSSLGISTSATFATPFLDQAEEGESDRTTVLVSPQYTRELTDDWTLAAGYTLRGAEEAEESGFTFENIVFLRLSRGLSLLP